MMNVVNWFEILKSTYLNNVAASEIGNSTVYHDFSHANAATNILIGRVIRHRKGCYESPNRLGQRLVLIDNTRTTVRAFIDESFWALLPRIEDDMIIAVWPISVQPTQTHSRITFVTQAYNSDVKCVIYTSPYSIDVSLHPKSLPLPDVEEIDSAYDNYQIRDFPAINAKRYANMDFYGLVTQVKTTDECENTSYFTLRTRWNEKVNFECKFSFDIQQATLIGIICAQNKGDLSFVINNKSQLLLTIPNDRILEESSRLAWSLGDAVGIQNLQRTK